MNRTVSEELWHRANRVLVGGVNSPVRAFNAVGGTPIFAVRGAGAHIYDADGNAYIDYIMSWGPLAVGHAHPQVVAAVQRALANGASLIWVAKQAGHDMITMQARYARWIPGRGDADRAELEKIYAANEDAAEGAKP